MRCCRTRLTGSYGVLAADRRGAIPVAGGYQRSMKAFLIPLWRRPPLQACSAPEALELPLRPSSRLRIAACLFLLMVLSYAVELWLSGHRFAAPLVLLAAAGCAARRTAAGDPDCLVLAA